MPTKRSREHRPATVAVALAPLDELLSSARRSSYVMAAAREALHGVGAVSYDVAIDFWGTVLGTEANTLHASLKPVLDDFGARTSEV